MHLYIDILVYMYRYFIIYVYMLCIYIYLFITHCLCYQNAHTMHRLLLAACPAYPSHFVKNYTFPLGASPRPIPIYIQNASHRETSFCSCSRCGQGPKNETRNVLSITNIQVFFRYKFCALFRELLLLLLLLFFFFVCCFGFVQSFHCAGGMKKLHVPALSANRSSLCIVTHKIMHIEFSIIAMVVATAL